MTSAALALEAFGGLMLAPKVEIRWKTLTQTVGDVGKKMGCRCNVCWPHEHHQHTSPTMLSGVVFRARLTQGILGYSMRYFCQRIEQPPRRSQPQLKFPGCAEVVG
jgi:hypothetical protein